MQPIETLDQAPDSGMVGGLELWRESNRTNRANNGRVSEDRSSKATLLLTAPRSSQVVCEGFTPVSEWNCHARRGVGYVPEPARGRPIGNRVTDTGTNDPAPSMASTLEAFRC